MKEVGFKFNLCLSKTHPLDDLPLSILMCVFNTFRFQCLISSDVQLIWRRVFLQGFSQRFSRATYLFFISFCPALPPLSSGFSTLCPSSCYATPVGCGVQCPLVRRGLTFVSTINPTFGPLAESALGQVPCLEEESWPRSCSVSCLPQTLRACGFCDALPGLLPPGSLSSCPQRAPVIKAWVLHCPFSQLPDGLVHPLVEQPRFSTNTGIVSHSLDMFLVLNVDFVTSAWVEFSEHLSTHTHL